MTNSGALKVSSRGQMSLPAVPRRRWGLEAGGEVAYLDLGDVVVIAPGGAAALRRTVLEEVDDADWQAAHGGFGDPDLATE